MSTVCRIGDQRRACPVRPSCPRLSNLHFGWILLTVVPMILASCSKDHSTKPQTYALSGRVLLVGTLRNDVGDTLGVQRVEDADSVRVYLYYQGASLRDST